MTVADVASLLSRVGKEHPALMNTRDGGIWPVVRMVRPARMDDFIYGDLAPAKPMGLQALVNDNKR